MKKSYFLTIIVLLAGISQLGIAGEGSSKRNLFRVPEHISKLQAFTELYTAARYPYPPNYQPHPLAMLHLFITQCPGGRCDYVNGNPMKVDFSTYPDINTAEYDFGKTTAEEIFSHARKDQAFDISPDTYCDYCPAFLSGDVEKMPFPDDYKNVIGVCQAIAEKHESIEAFNPPSKLTSCNATFMIRNPFFDTKKNLKAEDFTTMSCPDALKTMQTYAEIDGRNLVDNLCVCGKQDDGSRKCYDVYSYVSILDAQRLIRKIDGDSSN